MSNWKNYKLEDIVVFGNGKVRPTTSGDIPIYGGNGILGYCNKSNYSGETVIIGRVGAYCGSVYYENRPIWVSDNALAVKPKNGFCTKFIYYYLKTLRLNEFAEGSSHPLVTQTLLNSIDIIITDNICEQERIAGILSSLDDKIDLLNRQNTTLEALAETLFRQWFIENQNPEWKNIKLGDLIKIESGKIATKDILDDNGYFPVLGANGEIGRSNRYLHCDRLIFTGRVGTIGNVFRIENEKVWLTDNTLIIKNAKWFNFIYFVLKLARLENLNVGSTQPLIRQSDIKELTIFLPSNELLNYFEIVSDILFEKTNLNKKQICTLNRLRDVILSKLINR